uniref:Alpha-type protein kinase domain-containing protein n=1 Tax=Panagrolaimus sp. PS1159 TaxID=55785 RepID=A0AC35F058_9BILA
MADDDVSWMKETVEDKPSAWTHEKKVTIKASRDPEVVQLRETNKRLRTIYEESGLTYGKDVEERDLPERLRTAMALRKKSIAAVFQSIKNAQNVELCFLVDVTGSMQPHIDEVRNSISQIVNSLKTASAMPQQQKTAKQLRCSFVAYRDHSDSKQFEILQFTESVETFRLFCAGLRADGGGDTPEDVFGGIEKALELSWSPNFGTKVIFHIADAPCHGKKYHDCGDSYPSGDPKGRTEADLFKRIIENGIDYYFGKINNSTDKMIKIFEGVYNQEITEFDIKNVKAITESVISAVSTSVLAGISKSTMVAVASRTKRSYTLIKDIPNWSLIPKKEGRFLNYEMPESVEDIVNDVPLQRKHPKKAMVQLAENPFAHGAERFAFYGRDVTYPEIENIVLKEYLHIGPGMNSAARYETTNQIQTVGSFLAKEFSKKLEAVSKKHCVIKFLKIKTLSLHISGKDYRFMSCEKQYSAENEFIRFTNNTDYGMLEETARKKGIDVDFVKMLMAFSHWTYQASKKQLMVVDLQGIINHSDGKTTVVLTDPAIHCTDNTRFGRMNLGEKGMENFFSRHQCNQFCKSLGLTEVRVKADD